jgi:class 3 adenylate cyclase
MKKLLKIFGAFCILIVILNFVFPLQLEIDYSKIVYDRNGEVLATFLNKEDKWRFESDLSEVSQNLIDAVLEKEDKYFYYHPGFNPISIGRAMVQNITQGEVVSGASTITMQVARLIAPKDRTIWNKVRELFTASQLEVYYTKDEILELYLNLVPFGSNIEGVKAVSIFYLNKLPESLSLSESIALSLIPNNPNHLKIGKYNDRINRKKNIQIKKYMESEAFPKNLLDDALSENFHSKRVKRPNLALQIANIEAIRQNEIKDKEIEIKDLEISQSQNEQYAVIGGAIGVAFIAIIVFRQRQRSEKLLLNILPMKIAKRLKKKERLIADDIECASIVFIDLVGFTAYSKDRKASDVLQMLNDVFDKFDGLIIKYGLEKIKTIGDGYMAAAGVPEPCDDHSVRATNFSLDVHIVLKEINEQMKTDIQARVGIESGPIVAGVIGDMKFAYDLWGDSVNTASRMESTGTPGLVHISSNVKRELDTQQHNFKFEELEPMQVKGKGEMITFMVHRK